VSGRLSSYHVIVPYWDSGKAHFAGNGTFIADGRIVAAHLSGRAFRKAEIARNQ